MDNFLGEIRLMSFPQAPRGWAYCQGQMMSISQNQALFSLLGTKYGGDGVTTFGLPNLRGQAAISQGKAPSGSSYAVGQRLGTETVALTVAQIPSHTHAVTGTLNIGGSADSTTPDATYPATPSGSSSVTPYATGSGPNATMGAALTGATLTPAGGNQPHENRQPFLALNYAIALQGIYPSRS